MPASRRPWCMETARKQQCPVRPGRGQAGLTMLLCTGIWCCFLSGLVSSVWHRFSVQVCCMCSGLPRAWPVCRLGWGASSSVRGSCLPFSRLFNSATDALCSSSSSSSSLSPPSCLLPYKLLSVATRSCIDTRLHHLIQPTHPPDHIRALAQPTRHSPARLILNQPPQ